MAGKIVLYKNDLQYYHSSKEGALLIRLLAFLFSTSLLFCAETPSTTIKDTLQRECFAAAEDLKSSGHNIRKVQELLTSSFDSVQDEHWHDELPEDAEEVLRAGASHLVKRLEKAVIRDEKYNFICFFSCSRWRNANIERLAQKLIQQTLLFYKKGILEEATIAAKTPKNKWQCCCIRTPRVLRRLLVKLPERFYNRLEKHLVKNPQLERRDLLSIESIKAPSRATRGLNYCLYGATLSTSVCFVNESTALINLLPVAGVCKNNPRIMKMCLSLPPSIALSSIKKVAQTISSAEDTENFCNELTAALEKEMNRLNTVVEVSSVLDFLLATTMLPHKPLNPAYLYVIWAIVYKICPIYYR